MRRISIIDGFFVLFLIGLTIAFYKVISPFIIDIILAVTLTHLFSPLLRLFQKKFNLNMSSSLTVVFAFLIIVVPLTVLGVLISGEASHVYANYKHIWPTISKKMIIEKIETLPALKEYTRELEYFGIATRFNEFFDFIFKFFLGFIRKAFWNITAMLGHFLLILILMFFLFIHGQSILARIKAVIPFSEQETNAMIREMTRIIDATLVGTFIIGLLEGIFGGVLFAVFGLPSPFLWGAIMVIISIIPLIGTNVILWPTALILVFQGRYVSGILIFLLGFIGISATQHLLKPKLLGDRSGLHPALVLISLIGGLMWMGPVGFLIGPIITGLFITLWNQFSVRFQSELKDRGAAPAESAKTNM